MNKSVKNLLTLITVLTLALSFLGAASAEEETVSVPYYVNALGKAQLPRECIIVQSGNEHKVLGEGWYVVRGRSASPKA